MILYVIILVLLIPYIAIGLFILSDHLYYRDMERTRNKLLMDKNK